jgi:ribosomal protein S12 methylthiotransferase
MRRFGDRERFCALLDQIRQLAPLAGVRSNFIVGFPGETDAEFEQLLDWLRAAQLDRVGAFKYSPVEGAAANAIAPAVPEELKQERYERFMQAAAQISRARLLARIGQRCRVLIDALEDTTAIARAASDAPEIDGVVRIADAAGLQVGQFAEVRITAASTYDLEASLSGAS